jgi:hypothetical protein
MIPSPRAARIADALREILARGLELTPDTLRFVDATFSQPSAAELAAILEDAAAPECDSLLELLFAPDDALQIELEDRLSLQAREPPASEAVVTGLTSAPLTVRFRFPDGRGTLEVALTPHLARRLVDGLRIDRELPPKVAEVIATAVSGRCRHRVRVMLRNARFDLTPAKGEFLCALIPQLDFQTAEDRACFAFTLELLAELPASADIHTALAARQQWLAKAWHHGRRLREQLAESNFETLRSRGQRLTWVDEALVRRHMDHVDRICVAVYGRAVPVDRGGEGPAAEIDGLPSVAELMRRLL